MPDLRDNTWTQCGTSLVWNAAALARVCSPNQVRSLREFLRLHKAGWPEGELKLANKRALVVAGLDATMDTHEPEAAIEWLEQTVYPAILDFQERVGDGGSEAALIFWLADEKRIHQKASDGSYLWHCTGEHRRQSIPIGRCIWNGAESSARKIMWKNAEGEFEFAGISNRRIS